MGSNGNRVTYHDIMNMQRDIMEFQERVYSELKDVRKEISRLHTATATDRTRVSSLLRRDTIGFVWDSINSLVAAIAIAWFSTRK
jgi:hypothetical protein